MLSSNVSYILNRIAFIINSSIKFNFQALRVTDNGLEHVIIPNCCRKRKKICKSERAFHKAFC